MRTQGTGRYDTWHGVTDCVPEVNLPVLICRDIAIPGAKTPIVEQGNRLDSGWWSVTEGPVSDVVFWTLMPAPPSMERIRREEDAILACGPAPYTGDEPC